MGGLCRTGDWRQSVLTTTKVSNGRKTCVFQLAWPLHSSCVGGAAALRSLALSSPVCVEVSNPARRWLAGPNRQSNPHRPPQTQSCAPNQHAIDSGISAPAWPILDFEKRGPCRAASKKLADGRRIKAAFVFARLGGRPGTATSTIRQACFNPFDTWQPKARRAPDRSALVPSTAVSISNRPSHETNQRPPRGSTPWPSRREHDGSRRRSLAGGAPRRRRACSPARGFEASFPFTGRRDRKIGAFPPGFIPPRPDRFRHSHVPQLHRNPRSEAPWPGGPETRTQLASRSRRGCGGAACLARRRLRRPLGGASPSTSIQAPIRGKR